MSSSTAAGTFVTTAAPASVGSISDVVVIPTGRTSMSLTVTGLDASNTVKTQKRTTPGGAFVDQVTYNANQSGTPVTVAAGEEWRLVQVTQQAMRDVRYVLSCTG